MWLAMKGKEDEDTFCHSMSIYIFCYLIVIFVPLKQMGA